MIPTDHKTLEHALLSPDCLMFSELIDKISNNSTLLPDRKRDMISGLTRIAKALNRPLSDIGEYPKAWGNCVLFVILAGIVDGFCPRNLPA